MATPIKENKVQCSARSKRTGERCKRWCAEGKTVCKWHGGNSKGAPKGNKNSLIHGAYEKLTRETMSAEEIAYANAVTIDPLKTLEEQLRILKVKELRIMRRMKAVIDAEMEAGQLDENGKKKPSTVVLTVSTMQAENYEGQRSKSITSTTESHAQNYLRLESALAVVQTQIQRVAGQIAALRAVTGTEDNDVPVIQVAIVDGRRQADDAAEENLDPVPE